MALALPHRSACGQPRPSRRAPAHRRRDGERTRAGAATACSSPS